MYYSLTDHGVTPCFCASEAGAHYAASLVTRQGGMLITSDGHPVETSRFMDPWRTS